MFIKMYASGTNVQRLAKSATKANGVLYSAYSEIEQSGEDDNIVRRKFYAANLDQLKTVVESNGEEVQPSWTKIWGKPNANKTFIAELFKSLVGENSTIPSLNLSQMTNETVSCFKVYTSAFKAQTNQVAKIVSKALPNYSLVILNGDHTSNANAEFATEQAIAQAKLDDKDGVIIIATTMGSRSYSISEIQSTIMAYDRGSVDASSQKVSRCVTPGNTFDGYNKEFGHIVDLSFDPNRSENIESLLIDEIIQVQKSQKIDIAAATTYVLNSIDLSKVNEFGYLEEVTEADMFEILSDNDNLLKVADITIDIASALETGIFDILAKVTTSTNKTAQQKTIVGENAINKIKIQDDDTDKPETVKKDPSIAKAEEILNEAVKSLNKSATSVYYMTMQGNTYRQCVEAAKPQSEDFQMVFGVSPSDVIKLLDAKALNENILDVVVQNSKKVSSIW